MLLMRTTRAMSLASAFISVSLISCGGSPAKPPTTGWQEVLSVTSTSLDLGISGIALDGQGNLFLAEFDDSRIYKYSTAGKLQAQWGEHGTGPGQLEAPDKLAFDLQGNLYVTEVGSRAAGVGQNSRVQKFSATGTPLAQWGTFGSGPGEFNSPVGIAIDSQGNIYVADIGNHRVQKLSSAGRPLLEWHTVGSGTGESTEIGYDLALDAAGNVYVTEPHPFSSGNDRIEKFSPSGERLAQWGGSGSDPGKFINPTGLALDGKGDVFVVDAGNNRIQELSPTGGYVAQWHSPADGLTFTSKVALDNHGSIYVSAGTKVFRLAL
jgi:DNA-binding beta-propeller fold protein YncE